MRSIILICMVLMALTAGVYWQVGDHEFLNFDDNDYVTENPHVQSGISVSNVVWAFTSVELCNWHPVTWLSHLADVQFYGMNSRGHYLTNVVIHILTTLILFLFLLRVTHSIWQSFFVAALFALHPLHIESVAWVAERKDVLCAFFWFLTLYLYSVYVEKQKPVLYVFTLIFFVLGLMSKPMLVTLPVIMMLMDFWPLNRIVTRNNDAIAPDTGFNSFSRFLDWLTPLLKEKLPFFVLSLLSSGITIYAQQKGGAVSSLKSVSFLLRMENSFISYLAYFMKTLWPQKLAIIYPYPSSIPLWQVTCSLLFLLLVSVTTILMRRRRPYLLVGWVWFLVTLLPVIGLIQVGGQSMADRYTYIPIVGLFIMIAWGVPCLAKDFRYSSMILMLLACTVIVASATVTWKQLKHWQNGVSVFQHAINVTTGNCIAHYNLGIALFERGYIDAGAREFKMALDIDPNDPQAHNNMAIALDKIGNLNGAISEFKQSININPTVFEPHCNLGIALLKSGAVDDAIIEFRKALLITPNESRAQYYLEHALNDKKMK